MPRWASSLSPESKAMTEFCKGCSHMLAAFLLLLSGVVRIANLRPVQDFSGSGSK